MDSVKVFKQVSLVILFIILGINAFFFYSNNQKESEFEAIAKENQKLKDEIESLKEMEKNITNTAREKTFNDLMKQAKQFVNLVYVQKVEGYQKRKKEAINVMNEELQKRYFPSDEYNQTRMESSVNNGMYYVENMEMGQREVDVLIELDYTIEYLEVGKEDRTKTYIRVTFEKQDDKWIATNIKDLFSDTRSINKENQV